MIAVLQDKKGFRKEMQIGNFVPRISVPVKRGSLAMVKDGIPDMSDISFDELEFIFMQEINVFGSKYLLYQEI